MFDNSVNKNANEKNKKAVLYAGITTLFIAILYLILLRQNIYKFNGVKKDVAPAANFIKEVKQKIDQDIETGNKIIDNKN